MNDTKKTAKINCIKEKVSELCDEIEDLIEWTSPDETAELISDELGDFLKKSPGFKELKFGSDLAQTASERATLSLEEATREMKDGALTALFELSTNAGKIVKLLDGTEPSEVNWHKISFVIEELKKVAPAVREQIVYTWWNRTDNYRSEIEELTKATQN